MRIRGVKTGIAALLKNTATPKRRRVIEDKIPNRGLLLVSLTQMQCSEPDAGVVLSSH